MPMHAHLASCLPRLCALVAMIAASTGALAQDNGIYLGAAVSDVSTSYDWRDTLLGAASDDDSSGFKLIGGFRPFDRLAFEVNYADLGTAKAPLGILCTATVGFPCPSEASIDASAISVSALGFVTFPLLDFYGRVGVARWEADGDVRFTMGGGGSTMRMKREGTDPTVGVGIQFRLRSVALRAEYEYFEILDESADSLSIGLTYTFL